MLAKVVDVLTDGGDGSAARALSVLRDAVKKLGAPRRPPSGNEASEQRQIGRLNALASRIRADVPLVPGMTIHQAKGQEWNKVGIRLSDANLGRLGAGLNAKEERDRALYVALTRARRSVRRVA